MLLYEKKCKGGQVIARKREGGREREEEVEVRREEERSGDSQ